MQIGIGPIHQHFLRDGYILRRVFKGHPATVAKRIVVSTNLATTQPTMKGIVNTAVANTHRCAVRAIDRPKTANGNIQRPKSDQSKKDSWKQVSMMWKKKDNRLDCITLGSITLSRREVRCVYLRSMSKTGWHRDTELYFRKAIEIVLVSTN